MAARGRCFAVLDAIAVAAAGDDVFVVDAACCEDVIVLSAAPRNVNPNSAVTVASSLFALATIFSCCFANETNFLAPRLLLLLLLFDWFCCCCSRVFFLFSMLLLLLLLLVLFL